MLSADSSSRANVVAPRKRYARMLPGLAGQGVDVQAARLRDCLERLDFAAALDALDTLDRALRTADA